MCFGYIRSETHDMTTRITFVILPGLAGTEVLFRPLLTLLPDWIHPVVICYPARGPHDYAGLLKIVRENVAALPSFVVLASSFSGPLAMMLAPASDAPSSTKLKVSKQLTGHANSSEPDDEHCWARRLQFCVNFVTIVTAK